MIVREVAGENSSQVGFVDYDDMREALSADTAVQAFNVRIGLRCQIHPMVPVRCDFFRLRIPSIHLTGASLR